MTMDAKTLRDSATPPKGLSGPLTALWHAAKGEWEKAHQLVMDDESKEAAWVHAHLHRVEGDQSNAEYWYRRAGKPVSDAPLDDEWLQITAGLMLRP
ncbi:MAG: hypothetical protein WD626_02375 [Bauldia sp.]